jgi:hypothetical protein
MTRDRFAALLEAYGADPAHWPASERQAAQALAEADPAGGRARAEAAALDRILNAAPVEPPSAELMARVMAAAPAAPAAVHRPRPAGRLQTMLRWLLPGAGTWQPAAATAAALVLGLAVGYATAPFGTGEFVDGQSLDVIALGTFAEPEVSL